MLQPGEAVALLSSGLVEILQDQDGANWQTRFCDLVVRHLDLPADRIMRADQEQLGRGLHNAQADRTLVLVKRKADR